MKRILYEWGGVNTGLFHVINGLHSPALDQFLLYVTLLSSHRNFIFYVGLLLLIIGGKSLMIKQPEVRHAELYKYGVALLVFVLAYYLNGLSLMELKEFFHYPRPLLALPEGSVHVVGVPEYHNSLPSGHASFAMLIAASFWRVISRLLRVVAAGFVACVGISRINLGAHFPADVLAGFLLSLAIVIITRALINWLGPKSKGMNCRNGQSF